MFKRTRIPEAGKVGPLGFGLVGGWGAGRFGRTRVCGTTAAVRKDRAEEETWIGDD